MGASSSADGPLATVAQDPGSVSYLLADGAVDIVERTNACKAIENDNKRLSRRFGDRRAIRDCAAEMRARSDGNRGDVDMDHHHARPLSVDYAEDGGPRRARGSPRGAARRERTPRGRPRELDRNVEAARAYRRMCEEAGGLVDLD